MSRLQEIIHSKANIVTACGSCCSVSVTSLRVCQGQTFEIVRTCWCAIGAELIGGCLAVWQEGFTIRAVSACDSMTMIGEDQIQPLFVTLALRERANLRTSNLWSRCRGRVATADSGGGTVDHGAKSRWKRRNWLCASALKR